ncbi:hypothetical protein CcCBS67573_g03015 [Chytriomyces confervae]|uniref:ATP-dependent DNA ligase family profile domain-containing protein n=1 Tax=Chytriomyces confervae TaxID=246404 RepID=A0A507FH46_9FUNG|nr:hypothetical protein CcCBS67573_g03015 [Chytriomyces confervae]
MFLDRVVDAVMEAGRQIAATADESEQKQRVSGVIRTLYSSRRKGSYSDGLLLAQDGAKVSSSTSTANTSDYSNQFQQPFESESSLLSLVRLLVPQLERERVYSLKATGLARLLDAILHTNLYQLVSHNAACLGDAATVLLDAISQVPALELSQRISLDSINASLDQLALCSDFTVLENGVQQKPSMSQLEAARALFASRTTGELSFLIKVVLKMPVLPVHESCILNAIDARMWRLVKRLPSLRGACRAIQLEQMAFTQEKQPVYSVNDLISYKAVMLHTNLANVALMKATSCAHVIKHMQSISERSFVAEVKYDGERNQIHFSTVAATSSSTQPNVACPPKITLFSKSKRNSTQDRILCHDIILAALGHTSTTNAHLVSLKHPSKSYIRVHDAIFDSELLVFNELTQSIEPFHEARAFASDRIRASDPRILSSQLHYHLVFFDIMRLNGESLLVKPYHERRAILKRVIREIPNYSCVSEARVFFLDGTDDDNFEAGDEGGDCGGDLIRCQTDGLSQQTGLKRPLIQPLDKLQQCCAKLRTFFLRVCARPAEGLVCKGMHGNYEPGNQSLWMKLKKDYIEGFGDTADFAVIGASYQHDQTEYLGITRKDYPQLFNSFFVGCVTNRTVGTRPSSDPPKFTISFNFSAGFSREGLIQFNQSSTPFQRVNLSKLSYNIIPSTNLKPQVFFDPPIAVELKGGGFECRYGKWALRGPRYLRTCDPDRGWWSCVTHAEFKAMGLKASQPDPEWGASLSKMEAVDARVGLELSNRMLKNFGTKNQKLKGNSRAKLLPRVTETILHTKYPVATERTLSIALPKPLEPEPCARSFAKAEVIPWRNVLLSSIAKEDLKAAYVMISPCQALFTENKCKALMKPLGIENVHARFLYSLDALLACTGWDGSATDADRSEQLRAGILVTKNAAQSVALVRVMEERVSVASYCYTETLVVVEMGFLEALCKIGVKRA